MYMKLDFGDAPLDVLLAADGCEAYDLDTGVILKTWVTTAQYEDWTPPPGVIHIGLRPRSS